MQFKNISNDILLSEAETAVETERDATLEVLRYFRAIESRRLYAERGYSSLYDMARKHFGYDEGEAYRRVSAMRLIKEVPELEKNLEEGSLSLTVAAKVQSFSRKHKKNARNIAQAVIGKSKREAEKELLRIAPQAIPEESIKQVTDTYSVLTLPIDNALIAELDELRSLRSHVNPAMSYVDLIRQLALLGKAKWGRQRRKAPSPEMSKAAENREVFRRAKEQCEYTDPKTGIRCDCKHLLEVDHVVPLAAGGPDTLENKRILCRTHNQLAAIQKLGRRKMDPYLRF